MSLPPRIRGCGCCVDRPIAEARKRSGPRLPPDKEFSALQTLFDTELSIARKRRALALAVQGADFLMARAADDLAERLSAVERRFAKAAALYCVTPAARDAVLESGKADEVIRIEADAAFLGNGPGLVAAPERLLLEPGSIDLAVSLLALHEANDIPGMLAQIRRALKPDGLFLGCMAGAATLFIPSSIAISG